MVAYGDIQPSPVVGYQTFISQNVAGTAVLISGITALSLDMGKQNTAWIQCHGADIRYRWDGSSPTTTDGHVLKEDVPLLVRGKKNILNFRFIGDAGAASIVAITLDDSARSGGIV